MSGRIGFKRGDRIEVYALDEWMLATFLRVRRDGAVVVRIPREALDSDPEAKVAALDADYQAKRAPLWADYRAKIAPLWADYEAKRAPLWADYRAR